MFVFVKAFHRISLKPLIFFNASVDFLCNLISQRLYSVSVKFAYLFGNLLLGLEHLSFQQLIECVHL
jgi:hypothetical protein